jgi:hypothetical protein
MKLSQFYVYGYEISESTWIDTNILFFKKYLFWFHP